MSTARPDLGPPGGVWLSTIWETGADSGPGRRYVFGMRFGGIVVAAALILGACSSDPAPKEPTTSAPSASPATPAPAAPTMPPQAQEDSPEGAAAFVKHYIALVNFAANTGETSSMIEASANCEACESFAGAFAQEPEDGERFGGKLWTLNQVAVRKAPTGVVVRAELTVRQAKSSRGYAFEFTLTPSAPFRVRDISSAEVT